MSKAVWTAEERQQAEDTWLKSNNSQTLLHGSLAVIEEDGGIRFKRKLRLFAVACVSRVSHLFKDDRSRHWLDILEQNADGLISDEEQDRRGTTIVEPANEDQYKDDNPEESQVGCAWQALCLASEYDISTFDANSVAGWARYAAYPKPGPFDRTDEERVLHDSIEEGVQVALLRDVFGNPFRPLTVDPFWVSRNSGIVVKIAQCIYTDRTFDDLPILADALEEAGCTDAAILSHCRGPGPHVRGCWAVDLILGKE